MLLYQMYKNKLFLYQVATILYIVVCMDDVGLPWLDLLPCQDVPASDMAMEEGVATQV